jgi:hypothetical protein
MKHYYIERTHDPGQAYTLYVVEARTLEEIQLQDLFDVARITRRQAIERGIRLPNRARRARQPAPSAFIHSEAHPVGVRAVIEDAARATGQALSAAVRIRRAEDVLAAYWAKLGETCSPT